MTARRITAIHEAGHAIAAAALGITVVHVALDGAAGRVRTRGPENTVDGVERSLICTMCGPAAEHILAGTPLSHPAFRSDHRHEIELLQRLPFAEPRRRKCWSQAVDLVYRNRRAIEALADELMETTYGAVEAMAARFMMETNG